MNAGNSATEVTIILERAVRKNNRYSNEIQHKIRHFNHELMKNDNSSRRINRIDKGELENFRH